MTSADKTESIATLSSPAHIRIDEQGQVWIDGTSYRVLDVVMDHLLHGFSPSEIQYQHYGELTMAQVYSALAYYHDHRGEMDEEIRREADAVEHARDASGESPAVRRLRAEGKLP
jgi:uncharacterized protein (DUF433 family)